MARKNQPTLVFTATIRLKPTDAGVRAIDDPELLTDQLTEDLDGTEIYWEDPDGEREDGVGFEVDLREVQFVRAEKAEA